MTIIANAEKMKPALFLKMGVGDQCVLVGQGILLIHCAKHLMDAGVVIANIFTEDAHIKTWAQDNNISLLHSMQELLVFVENNTIEFLFSIVNPYIIPQTVLDQIQVCSINYHDSPLPYYAGTNASTWALLSGETDYAISWHIIDTKVDAGYVLIQQPVTIADEDTSFTLNLKCNDAALIGFKNLVDKLFNNNLVAIPQNLDLRTFYPSWKRPLAGCCFQWNQPAKDLHRLFNAMDYGFHMNPLGLPKILIGNTFYTFSRFKVEDYQSTEMPGTLVALEEGGIKIATKTNDVFIGKIKTLEGNSISIKWLAEQHSLVKKEALPIAAIEAGKLWQEKNELLARHENFWVGILKNSQFVSELPLVKKAKDTATGVSAITRIQSATNKIANVEQWIALLLAFIARLNANKTVHIGFKPSGLGKEVEVFYNFFSATLPLEVDIDLSEPFGALVDKTKRSITVLLEKGTFASDIYQRYPLLQKKFSTVENMSWPIVVEIGSAAIQYHANDALTMHINEDTKECFWVWDSAVFDNHTMEKWLSSFEVFTDSLLASTEKLPGEVPVLGDAEYNQVVFDFNQTDYEFDTTLCIHELFERQVVSSPRAIALEFAGATLTYTELNQRANQFARYLQQKGLKKGSHAVLCMDRGIDCIVSFLALCKTGAVYIPVDPDYPLSRIEYILEDSEAEWIITSQQIKQRVFSNTMLNAICFDQQNISNDSNPVNIDKNTLGLTAEDLVYIIYTSGSTGKPKGTLIAHKGLCNLALAQKVTFDVSGQSRVLQFASIAFDAAISEIIVTLCAGATLVLTTRSTTQDPTRLSQLIKQQNISHITLPPVLLPHLTINDWQGVKSLAVAGEACPYKYAREWAKGRRFINAYGPTETTICASMGIFNVDDPVLHIGKPINNFQLYVLNEYLQPQPVNIPGELFIAGVGLAKGYLNRPELNAEKFIANPFKPEGCSQLYRTGDLVRWLDNGNLEFLGRMDTQVKIHGYRIEPGEIENCLLDYPGISEAAVIVKAGINDSRRLVAYIVSSGNLSSQENFLDIVKEYLLAHLPEYMVPAQIILLDKLPLTVNGKLDKQALTEFTTHQSIDASDSQASDVEKAMVEVWKNVLSLDQIGIGDDFFKSGGNSILVIFAISQLKQKGFVVSAEQIYQYRTIAALAQVAIPVIDQTAPPSLDALVVGKAPLLPNMMDIFSEWEPDHWNSSFILRIAIPYTADLLRQAVSILLQYHDALRTLWHKDDKGEWFQYFQSPEEMHPWWTRVDLTQCADEDLVQEIEKISAAAQFTLNLSKVLFKVIYFDAGDGRESRILFVLSHLLIDNYSNYIFISDLGYVANRLHHGLPVQLPPRTASVKYLAEAYKAYTGLSQFEQDLHWWLDRPWERLQPLPQEVYTDKLEEKHFTYVARDKLTIQETRQLEEIPLIADVSLQDILLTAMLLAYREWSGNDTLLLSMTHHGRTANAFKNADVSRTVALLPIPAAYFLEIPDSSSLKEIAWNIKKQKEALQGREASLILLQHGDYWPHYKERLQALPKPQLKINIFGRLPKEVVENEHGFYWTPENPGPMVNPDPEGLYNNGFQPYSMTEFEYGTDCLAVQWAYSAACYTTDTMERFLALNMHYIRQLIRSFS